MNIPKAFLLIVLQILDIQKSWKTSGDPIIFWFCRRNYQFLLESTKTWLWILGVKGEIQRCCFVPLWGDHPTVSIPLEMKINSSTCNHWYFILPLMWAQEFRRKASYFLLKSAFCWWSFRNIFKPVLSKGPEHLDWEGEKLKFWVTNPRLISSTTRPRSSLHLISHRGEERNHSWCQSHQKPHPSAKPELHSQDNSLSCWIYMQQQNHVRLK